MDGLGEVRAWGAHRVFPGGQREEEDEGDGAEEAEADGARFDEFAGSVVAPVFQMQGVANDLVQAHRNDDTRPGKSSV